MDSIHLRPALADMRTYIDLTRQTLWCPAWPGDERARQEFEHWPLEIQRAVYLIYDGREAVGRVIAPQFDDFMTIRDLGLRQQPGLLARVSRALLGFARQRGARDVRVVVYEPWWLPFEAMGFVEQKRRVSMQLILKGRPPAAAAYPVRSVLPADSPAIGDLLHAAYRGTIDDEGEDREQWIHHAGDVLRGNYGPFLPGASFAMPVDPPFQSATLVIETTSQHALLGQVVTRPASANQGRARALINHSLDALTVLGYSYCFLEVTTDNSNAVHLYRTLGFADLGPQVVYGIKTITV